MRTIRSTVRWATVACLLAALLVASAQTAKPEEVGLSTARLKQVADLVQRHISAGNFSGAVTLVARNGRIGCRHARCT